MNWSTASLIAIHGKLMIIYRSLAHEPQGSLEQHENLNSQTEAWRGGGVKVSWHCYYNNKLWYAFCSWQNTQQVIEFNSLSWGFHIGISHKFYTDDMKSYNLQVIKCMCQYQLLISRTSYSWNAFLSFL